MNAVGELTLHNLRGTFTVFAPHVGAIDRCEGNM